MFVFLKKLTDSFFEGLKTNAVNSAIKQAKNNPTIQVGIVDRMKQINKLAKEVEDDIKKYE